MNKSIIGVAVILISTACTKDDPEGRGEMDLVRVHVRVDRAVIFGTDASTVLDPVWWTANIYDGPKEYEASLASFTRSQRLFHAILWYRAEVDNGGHDQFYSNSTGIVWKDALAGLELLGLDAFASILRESAVRLGGEPALDREARQVALEKLERDFEDLDDRFYELQKTVDLDSIMLSFMQAHVKDFEFDGFVKKPVDKDR